MAALRIWAVAALASVAACSGSGAPRLAHLTDTQDYLPGVAADLFLPAAVDPQPLVVLVPGGAWQSADRTGLRPLADALAAHGVAAVTATYRIGSADARFPTPVADIVCAVDFAVSTMRDAGRTPGPVVLLGHSSGAELAADAALATEHFRSRCPYPRAHITGFVGLAGAYDLLWYRDAAVAMFGAQPAEDPAAWRAADPFTWARHHRELRVLLLHGTADSTVSTMDSDRFATSLRAGGHHVQFHLVPRADHATIYHADVAAEPILRWLRALGA